MRKVVSVIAAACLLAAFAVPAAAAGDISAKSAIVMDGDTGDVLFEKNADERLRMASTTKIMTALVVLETCDLDAEAEITAGQAATEGSSVYLKPGEKVKVETLLYGLLLESGNDAAAALACKAAGTEKKFAKLMNARAAELGCENTRFANPHGLDAEEHYSTARDMALIMAAAMKNGTFCRIVSTKDISVGGRTFSNHNKLLWSYNGCIGGKTGYTKSSGRSLVSCAQRDGIRLICVTLNAPDDWNDHMALYDEAFSAWKKITVSPEEHSYEVPVITGAVGAVTAEPKDSAGIRVPADADTEVSVKLKKFVYAPVRAGDSAGSITVTADREELFSTALIFAESAELGVKQKLTGRERLKKLVLDAVERAIKKLGYEPER